MAPLADPTRKAFWAPLIIQRHSLGTRFRWRFSFVRERSLISGFLSSSPSTIATLPPPRGVFIGRPPSVRFPTFHAPKGLFTAPCPPGGRYPTSIVFCPPPRSSAGWVLSLSIPPLWPSPKRLFAKRKEFFSLPIRVGSFRVFPSFDSLFPPPLRLVY